MTRIKPFYGILYNKNKISDISKVVCPPYDIISKQEQDRFYSVDAHNFIRVILGKDEASDDKETNKYTRSKKYFDQWYNDGILEKDKMPCLYFYSHEYSYRGKKKKRQGFIGLMKLEEGGSKVFPHEKTHSKPKQDRLELIRAVPANLCPIFAFFHDKEKKISQVFKSNFEGKEPDLAAVDKDGVSHKIWRFCDSRIIDEIKDSMEEEQIFIADGHHRYEVAMNYSREMHQQEKDKTSSEKDYDYIMTYFTNLDSEDLLILPIHRVVKTMPQPIKTVENNFTVQKMKNKEELFSSLEKITGGIFGFYQGKEFYLLQLKDKERIKDFIPHGSDNFKRLDVSILQFLIFDQLGIKLEDLIYTNDEVEALRIVDDNEAEAAFFINPLLVQHLRDIALGGEKMPPKSTYFYPKPLSGLVINKFKS